ncbi:hypothetical protein EV702DRAFT_1048715 [Suillus placidus]|uniref:Uncharacterized protein n=1 Tax=Suillus placidus TaxID=48579 RepID=A0A9P7CY67_9AGAM|nr:hypothetical protein EV702DRAFT_1048715 [Suillus placidus]
MNIYFATFFCLATLTLSLKSIDLSFRLLSTWVPPGIQEALDQACHSELHSQVGLMATYLDMEGYHSHQRNPELELLHLHANMCRAKAEVEVYELAIENAPASNSSDSNTSSSPGPTLQPPLEEMSYHQECIYARSVVNRWD